MIVSIITALAISIAPNPQHTSQCAPKVTHVVVHVDSRIPGESYTETRVRISWPHGCRVAV